jgi:hypothetical protein
VQAHDLAANNDTILLIVIPATSCRDVAASKALKLAQELDSDGQWLFLFFPIIKSGLPICFCFGDSDFRS